MTTPNNYEVKTEQKGETAIRQSLIGELWSKTKTMVDRLKTSSELGELSKEGKEIAVRQVVLTGLALAEAIPGAEMVNEGTKWAEVAKWIKEKAPAVKKEGKILDLIPELYPDLPKWFVAGMATVDIAGVPLAGAAPELIQLAIDTIWNNPKNVINKGKEVASIARDVFLNKSEYTQQQVQEAVLVFNPSEGGN